MMIGSQKLLLSIAVPSEHLGRPLNQGDARILDIAVAKSWNGEAISKQVQKVIRRVGKAPAYAITDNAGIMRKGIAISELDHHLDISHSMGMFLERIYKNENDFIQYCKSMTDAKSKHCMKDIAYLLPPSQRTISRFLNLGNWVEWSKRIISIYHNTNKAQRDMLSFVPKNASLIDELSSVMECINKILKTCKHKGLSHKTAQECIADVSNMLFLQGNPRMIRLGKLIVGYFNRELNLIQLDTAVRNNSSDIIESCFGVFKYRKAPDKLVGVTSFILLIPIHTRLQQAADSKPFDFKGALEATSMKDLDVWKKETLQVNPMKLRNGYLKSA